MKYIQDFLRNKSRMILSGLSLPQRKAVSEVIRGLMTVGKPILRQLAQNGKKNARKQGEKYGHHLERIDLRGDVELFALKNAKTGLRRDTIIAYDLSDISKECAGKMEKLAPVFDGSRRKGSNGYLLHGIGVNNILLHLGVHEGNEKTINQTRLELVKRFSSAFNKKGIWVFDRGNDDKQFFTDLRQKLNVQFIARLRSNRLVVVKESGVVEKVGEMYPGQYTVFLFDKHNRKVNTELEYTLTISKHLEDCQPIRLLSSTIKRFMPDELVEMYLERWGIENIFKRAKQKFELERIRVLKYQKFVNLIALIQFVIVASTVLFSHLQRTTFSLLSGVVLLYRKFIHQKNITFNLDSFISFLQATLKPLVFHLWKDPPLQLNLFSSRQMEKLGTI